MPKKSGSGSEIANGVSAVDEGLSEPSPAAVKRPKAAKAGPVKVSEAIEDLKPKRKRLSKVKRLAIESEADRRRMRSAYVQVVDGFRKTLRSLHK